MGIWKKFWKKWFYSSNDHELFHEISKNFNIYHKMKESMMVTSTVISTVISIKYGNIWKKFDYKLHNFPSIIEM